MSFLAVCGVLVALYSILLTPLSEWNNRVPISGLYDQPPNTVQVACLGTSTVLSGFSANELYERKGIAAWSCSTGSQPSFSSYYLLKDLIRLQGESLRVVVFDPSSLVLDRTSQELRRDKSERTIKDMALSPVKFEAIFDAARYYSDTRFFELIVPVLRYHSGWSELRENNFAYLLGKQDDFSGRGQYVRYLTNAINGVDSSTYAQNNDAITKDKSFETEHLESVWDESELEYVERMIELCRSEGIEMVFIQTPRIEWDDEAHDSIQLLANRHSIPFIDYCAPEMRKEINLDYASDLVDKRHPNYHGACKIMDHLGGFLASNYELDDVRSDPAYARLADDAAQYDELAENARLVLCDDLDEYLDLISNDRYTVFVAVRGDAAHNLGQGARDKLASLGFKGLAKIGEGQAYVGVASGGLAVRGRLQEDSSEAARLSGTYHNGNVVADDTDMQPDASFSHAFILVSKGFGAGNSASMVVDGDDVCVNGTGLNFAVYDTARDELLDACCFNTHADCARTADALVAE